MNVRIINLITGEETTRPMTAEEIAFSNLHKTEESESE